MDVLRLPSLAQEHLLLMLLILSRLIRVPFADVPRPCTSTPSPYRSILSGQYGRQSGCVLVFATSNNENQIILCICPMLGCIFFQHVFESCFNISEMKTNWSKLSFLACRLQSCRSLTSAGSKNSMFQTELR